MNFNKMRPSIFTKNCWIYQQCMNSFRKAKNIMDCNYCDYIPAFKKCYSIILSSGKHQYYDVRMTV